MRYVFDHDYHLHTNISPCANSPEQTPERLIRYAKDCGLHTVCITDHYWDSTVPFVKEKNHYVGQDFDRISSYKPLPEDKDVNMLFGCESDIDLNMTLGIPESRFNDFDFMIIPTTHMHMNGFTIAADDDSNEARARLWVERLDALLNMELPFGKVGIPHLATLLINKKSKADLEATLNMISNDDMERLFSKAAKLGVGIELNYDDMLFRDADVDITLRMFRIAKSCGCKFYCGSDAHTPLRFDKVRGVYDNVIDLLELKESDKFYIKGIKYR